MKAPADTITNALAAAAIGVLQLGVGISLAALIFSGELSEGAGRAAAGFVLGTAIVSAIVGSTTKMSVVTAGAQDTAAVMVAAVAAAIVASPDMRSTEMLPTVVVMIAIAGVATGAVFWLLGRYGLSSFVRFLPYPVVSGFTAGTGWLLLRGGIEVMRGEAIPWRQVHTLVDWPELKFLLPGIALALLMLIVVSTDRLPNALVSVAILGGVVLFHLVGRSTSSFDELEAQGWFIGPFNTESGWSPVGPDDFADTNWSVLANNTHLIAAIVAVAVIGVLLNLSGLENGPDAKINMNTEMQSAGIANVLAGAGGGLVGYHLLGDTLLGRQLGARGRIVPLAIAAMAAVTFLIGPGLIAQVPRSIAGGVLAGLGISMLVAWARTSVPLMNRSDKLLSSLILLAIALFGVLTGVGVGVIVAAAVFIVKYSRTDPLRHVLDAAGRSAIDRDEPDAQLLASAAGAILAFELQGYLFFGSITGVRQQIERHVDERGTQFVIIDFARVTGIDSTACGGLMAIASQLSDRGVVPVYSGATDDVAEEIDRQLLAVIHRESTLDHAIAWCEDQVLAGLGSQAAGNDDGPPAPFEPEIMRVLDLPAVTLEPGETLLPLGDTDSDVYFVESGRLTAWLPAEDGSMVRIRQVLPGAALGEVSFCTGTPRTATVIADGHAVVRVLRRDRFDALTIERPEVAIAIQRELLRRLGARVSTTSAMVRDLLR